jgi:hypothetical protein
MAASRFSEGIHMTSEPVRNARTVQGYDTGPAAVRCHSITVVDAGRPLLSHARRASHLGNDSSLRAGDADRGGAGASANSARMLSATGRRISPRVALEQVKRHHRILVMRTLAPLSGSHECPTLIRCGCFVAGFGEGKPLVAATAPGTCTAPASRSCWSGPTLDTAQASWLPGPVRRR